MKLNLNPSSIQYYSNLTNRSSYRAKYPRSAIKSDNQRYSSTLRASVSILIPILASIDDLPVNLESISKVSSALLYNFPVYFSFTPWGK